MKTFLILLKVGLIFSFIIFGCEDISTEIDPVVHIINSYKSGLMGGSVIVKYQIKILLTQILMDGKFILEYH